MEASRLPRRRDGLPEMNRITIESADFKVTVEYERATDEINELVANLLRRWHAGMEVITEHPSLEAPCQYCGAYLSREPHYAEFFSPDGEVP